MTMTMTTLPTMHCWMLGRPWLASRRIVASRAYSVQAKESSKAQNLKKPRSSAQEMSFTDSLHKFAAASRSTRQSKKSPTIIRCPSNKGSPQQQRQALPVTFKSSRYAGQRTNTPSPCDLKPIFDPLQQTPRMAFQNWEFTGQRREPRTIHNIPAMDKPRFPWQSRFGTGDTPAGIRMNRKILIMGDPRLLRHAQPVSTTCFGSSPLQLLVQDIFNTMDAAGGNDLAAPQIGFNLQILVFRLNLPNSPASSSQPRRVLINPQIEVLDHTEELGWEESLSIPGLRGEVPRARRIRYQGVDEHGHPVDEVAEGWHARMILRLYDYLIGRLYPSRIKDFARFEFIETRIPQYSLPGVKDGMRRGSLGRAEISTSSDAPFRRYSVSGSGEGSDAPSRDLLHRASLKDLLAQRLWGSMRRTASP